MKKENVHDGHRDRVKDKFIHHGLGSFADHQVLELLLFYCYDRRKDTNEAAHKMIAEFGMLHSLFNASTQDIMRRCGVSKHIAVLVSMIPQLLQRYIHSQWARGVLLDSPRVAGEFCSTLLFGRVYECMFLVCLDRHRRLIFAE